MSKRGGYGGTGVIDGTNNSAVINYDYDVVGQDPSTVMAGLDPTQLAANGVDFSGVNLDGVDFQALGLDETFFSALNPITLDSMGDASILDAVPLDGVGNAVADAGSSFWDVVSDIFSGLF
ncbi:hypothetical protein GCM10028808_57910 [Spirosoma migulaei]